MTAIDFDSTRHTRKCSQRETEGGSADQRASFGTTGGLEARAAALQIGSSIRKGVERYDCCPEHEMVEN